MQLLKIIKGPFNLDRLRLSIKYHRRFFIFIFVAFFVGINARNIGEYYTTPWPSNRLRMEFDHRSSFVARTRDPMVQWHAVLQMRPKVQRTCSALLQPRIRRDATRCDATGWDGTDDPIDRDHSIRRTRCRPTSFAYANHRFRSVWRRIICRQMQKRNKRKKTKKRNKMLINI